MVILSVSVAHGAHLQRSVSPLFSCLSPPLLPGVLIVVCDSNVVGGVSPSVEKCDGIAALTVRLLAPEVVSVEELDAVKPCPTAKVSHWETTTDEL